MSTAKRTDPELWEKVKKEITRSGKGGEKGQWSARKAQLAVQEYKKRGGGYAGGKSDDNSLKQWTDEDWDTRSGRKSGDTGERYLPKKARESLSDEEYRRTSEKKRADKANGRQFSSQPADVARKTAKHRDAASGDDEPTKSELMERAKSLDVQGRSSMNKDELEKAVAAAEERRERFEAISKSDLVEAARILGVSGTSSKSKAELRAAIRDALRSDDGDDLTKSDATSIARTFEIDGRSSMNKDEIVRALTANL